MTRNQFSVFVNMQSELRATAKKYIVSICVKPGKQDLFSSSA